MNLFMLISVMIIFAFSGCTITQREATSSNSIDNVFPKHSEPSSMYKDKSYQINSSVRVEKQPSARASENALYCPLCGREFPASVEYCPYDGEKLGPKLK